MILFIYIYSSKFDIILFLARYDVKIDALVAMLDVFTDSTVDT